MNRFAGTLALARSNLRSDRIIAAVWVSLMILLSLASAAATQSLYASESARLSAAQALASSAAAVALYGPILDVHSVGEFSMTKMTVLYAVFGALLFVVIVRRHTRVEEERGLAELVGATPVGRDAAYAAALIESLLLSLLLGLGSAIAAMAGGLPASGSLLYGLSWVGTAWVAMAIASVAVQLSASARTCGAVAIGTLVSLYLVRAIGDVSWHPLSWLSPFGWNTQLRAWSNPRLWVLLLYPILAVSLVVLASALRSRRDLASGLIADRPGPAHGSPRLSTALGLAWRLNRTSMAIWSAAVAAMSTLAGGIVGSATSLLKGSSAEEYIRRVGGAGAIEDSLLAAEVGVIAIGITCFAIAVATHTAEDERAGRSEEVRATAVGRTSVWLAAALVALGGAAWLLVIAGLGLAVGSGHPLPSVVGAALAQIPAVWITGAITLCLLAVGSRFAGFGWAVLGAFVAAGLVGEALKLPHWIIGLSPYQHVPQLPAASLSWTPELILLTMTCALVAAGWAQFRYRDIA